MGFISENPFEVISVYCKVRLSPQFRKIMSVSVVSNGLDNSVHQDCALLFVCHLCKSLAIGTGEGHVWFSGWREYAHPDNFWIRDLCG